MFWKLDYLELNPLIQKATFIKLAQGSRNSPIEICNGVSSTAVSEHVFKVCIGMFTSQYRGPTS